MYYDKFSEIWHFQKFELCKKKEGAGFSTGLWEADFANPPVDLQNQPPAPCSSSFLHFPV